MALRRAGVNFKQGRGIKITLTDDAPLNLVDVEVAVLVPILAVWAGPLPTVNGAGLEFRVPSFLGISGTFNITSMFTRLSASPSGTVQFRVEKSTTHGAFSATTLGSTTHAATDYEKTASLSSTVNIGDLIRINYIDMSGGSGGSYEVELTGSLQ